MGHSKSARDMLKKYLKGSLSEEDRKGAKRSGVAPGSAPGSSAGGAGGGLLGYLVPLAVLAAAVWYQFLRPKEASA